MWHRSQKESAREKRECERECEREIEEENMDFNYVALIHTVSTVCDMLSRRIPGYSGKIHSKTHFTTNLIAQFVRCLFFGCLRFLFNAMLFNFPRSPFILINCFLPPTVSLCSVLVQPPPPTHNPFHSVVVPPPPRYHRDALCVWQSTFLFTYFVYLFAFAWAPVNSNSFVCNCGSKAAPFCYFTSLLFYLPCINEIPIITIRIISKFSARRIINSAMNRHTPTSPHLTIVIQWIKVIHVECINTILRYYVRMQWMYNIIIVFMPTHIDVDDDTYSIHSNYTRQQQSNSDRNPYD